MPTQQRFRTPRSGPNSGYTLSQSKALLPLVRAISAEVIERRQRRRELLRQREKLASATTPEGVSIALADLDAQVLEQEDAIHSALKELEEHGLTAQRANPIVVHFPGRTRDSRVVFCWREGDDDVSFGHACGEEDEPRQPLTIRP